MGPFRVNSKENIGDKHRVPDNDHREESEAFRKWDMIESRGRIHIRGGGNPIS